MNVRRLFPFALFVLLFAVAVRPTIDPDLWWHLRTGEAIVRDGIPHHDLFSFTYPMNEWVTHEWLSQVLMWGLYKLGGFNGLIGFFAAVTTVTWWLVYLLSDGKPYVAGMVVAVAAKASQVVWGSRPQLFNLFLFALFVVLLEKRKDGAVGRWVYFAFPAITLVWANLHSGYLLGIVVLATYLVGESLERRRRVPGPRTLPSADLAPLGIDESLERRRRVPGPRTLPSADLAPLGVATGAAALAALANPNGWRLWVYPFETLGSSVQRDLIAEWFPPSPDQLIFWLTVGLIVVGICGLVRASQRPSVTELLVFGGTAVGAFLSVRNIPIFAIAATPIICRYLVQVLPAGALLPPTAGDEERRLPTLVAGAAIGVAALAIAGGTLAGNAATVADRFPEAAVDWLEASGFEDDRLFNGYGWGGYLIWRGIPVYVDGRADVYGDEGLLNFRRTWEYRGRLGGTTRSIRGEPGVGAEGLRVLANVLHLEEGWRPVYDDQIATIFGRSG